MKRDAAVIDPDDDREDVAYDKWRQEQVDAEADVRIAQAKRRAAGISVEELFLEQVMTEGMHAGLKGKQSSENPYQAGLLEHDEWERCRALAFSCALAGMTA